MTLLSKVMTLLSKVMTLLSKVMNLISMSERRVLYFTAENHYLYRSTGNALELEAKFSADEAGVSEFRDALRGRRGTLFSVLVDLAGEDFHEDQIPVLRGSDREA